jgi:hypothetical protein
MLVLRQMVRIDSMIHLSSSLWEGADGVVWLWEFVPMSERIP